MRHSSARRWSRFLIGGLVLAALGYAVGCGSWFGHDHGLGSSGPQGTISITVHWPNAGGRVIPPETAKILVSVVAADLLSAVTGEITPADVVDGQATLSLSVGAGNDRVVSVRALDAADHVLAWGETIIDVLAEATTQAQVTLETVPAGGSTATDVTDAEGVAEAFVAGESVGQIRVHDEATGQALPNVQVLSAAMDGHLVVLAVDSEGYYLPAIEEVAQAAADRQIGILLDLGLSIGNSLAGGNLVPRGPVYGPLAAYLRATGAFYVETVKLRDVFTVAKTVPKAAVSWLIGRALIGETGGVGLTLAGLDLGSKYAWEWYYAGAGYTLDDWFDIYRVSFGAGLPVFVWVEPTTSRSRLRVSSSPPGARTYLDSVDTGKTTPCDIVWAPGEYSLTLRLTGYKDWSVAVDLVPLATYAVDAVLVPEGGGGGEECVDVRGISDATGGVWLEMPSDGRVDLSGLPLEPGVSVDVAVALDITGSMDELTGAKESLGAFADGLCGAGSDVRLGCVTFGDFVGVEDPSDPRAVEDGGPTPYRDLSADLTAFKAFLEGLQNCTGGDDPENDLDALMFCKGALTFRPGARRVCLLITDSRAHQRGDGAGWVNPDTGAWEEFAHFTLAEVLQSLVGNAVVHTVSPDCRSLMAQATRTNSLSGQRGRRLSRQ